MVWNEVQVYAIAVCSETEKNRRTKARTDVCDSLVGGSEAEKYQNAVTRAKVFDACGGAAPKLKSIRNP